jgi:hypothetical protein
MPLPFRHRAAAVTLLCAAIMIIAGVMPASALHQQRTAPRVRLLGHRLLQSPRRPGEVPVERRSGVLLVPSRLRLSMYEQSQLRPAGQRQSGFRTDPPTARWHARPATGQR